MLKDIHPTPYWGAWRFSPCSSSREGDELRRARCQGYASSSIFSSFSFFRCPRLSPYHADSTVDGALIAVGALERRRDHQAIKAGGIRLGALFLSLYAAGILHPGVRAFSSRRLVPVGNRSSLPPPHSSLPPGCPGQDVPAHDDARTGPTTLHAQVPADLGGPLAACCRGLARQLPPLLRIEASAPVLTSSGEWPQAQAGSPPHGRPNASPTFC